MLSHAHRFIFIHVPKTAGTSVTRALDAGSKQKRNHATIRDYQPITPSIVHQALCGGPGTMAALARCIKKKLRHQTNLTAQQYQTYFKFTYVRNPWSRVYSWYKNIQISPKQHPPGYDPDCTLLEFLERHGDMWALRPQLYWLQDWSGRVAVDCIYRYEQLQADFDAICSRLNLSPQALPMSRTPHGDTYIDAYCDKSRRWVAEQYKAEIEMFGYAFG